MGADTVRLYDIVNGRICQGRSRGGYINTYRYIHILTETVLRQEKCRNIKLFRRKRRGALSIYIGGAVRFYWGLVPIYCGSVSQLLGGEENHFEGLYFAIGGAFSFDIQSVLSRRCGGTSNKKGHSMRKTEGFTPNKQGHKRVQHRRIPSNTVGHSAVPIATRWCTPPPIRRDIIVETQAYLPPISRDITAVRGAFYPPIGKDTGIRKTEDFTSNTAGHMRNEAPRMHLQYERTFCALSLQK